MRFADEPLTTQTSPKVGGPPAGGPPVGFSLAIGKRERPKPYAVACLGRDAKSAIVRRRCPPVWLQIGYTAACPPRLAWDEAIVAKVIAAKP